MTVVWVIVALALAAVAWSIAWECGRLAWRALQQYPKTVRIMGSVVAFFVGAWLWPLLLVAALIVYRTPWPVSAGKLRPDVLLDPALSRAPGK